MIVRINQIDPRHAEQDAGWAPVGPLLPLPATGGDLRAFELLVLNQDEQSRPLTEAFRQAQLRHIIPHALVALRDPGEEWVLLLDGPLTDGELPAAFRWLADADGRGRFVVDGVTQLEDRPPNSTPPAGGLRLVPTPARLAGLCTDAGVGLERAVRLRAFCVPPRMVRPMLEAPPADVPRWAGLAEATGVGLYTTRGLRSLQILTRRLDAGGVKTRILQRLKTLAPTAQPTPAASAP